MDYTRQAYALVSKELETLLREEIGNELLDFRIAQIDRFLVDSRRQLRNDKADLKNKSQKLDALEQRIQQWQSNLKMVEEKGDEVLKERTRKRLGEHEDQAKELKLEIREFKALQDKLIEGLALLEDRAQDLRQRKWMKKSGAQQVDLSSDLDVDSLIES